MYGCRDGLLKINQINAEREVVCIFMPLENNLGKKMLLETLKLLFKRDLHKLKTEIESYQHEERLWIVEKKIPNSAGNLCLHLIGNLNTYIGAEIGKTSYIRDRESEFLLKGIPKSELIRMIEETMLVVNDSLDKMEEASLEDEYPLLVLETKTSTGYLLVHLATHLTYHLGQINYHRRWVES